MEKYGDQHTGKQGTGHGGKGLTDKVKEKLPGGNKDEQNYGTQRTTHAGGHGYGGGEHPEKKGVVEEIKEKLPGGHKDEQNYGTKTTTHAGGHGFGGGEHQEKKGVVEKVKEKLPGGGH
ncbi:cold-shock protein [Forsythia ovata]|uniref:Cold-shock protein n=1 Tax=Forsythia ovata TaxID=205694 RepID=A0ABD1U6A3_9LAMI